jgi:hypothetical protein
VVLYRATDTANTVSPFCRWTFSRVAVCGCFWLYSFVRTNMRDGRPPTKVRLTQPRNTGASIQWSTRFRKEPRRSWTRNCCGLHKCHQESWERPWSYVTWLRHSVWVFPVRFLLWFSDVAWGTQWGRGGSCLLERARSDLGQEGVEKAVFWYVTPCGSCKNRHFEERIAPIVKVTRIIELGAALAATSKVWGKWQRRQSPVTELRIVTSLYPTLVLYKEINTGVCTCVRPCVRASLRPCVPASLLLLPQPSVYQANKTNSLAFSPQATNTDWRNHCKLLLKEGCRVVSATAPHFRYPHEAEKNPFHTHYLSEKAGSAGNRTGDLWNSSQELWPPDHKAVILKE